MKLPSMIKGWFNLQQAAEQSLLKYQQTGDRRLLAPLFEQFNQTLFHYLLTQSDYHSAEDILQSTWLKVLHNAQHYQVNTSVKRWLFCIARNSLIDELRRQKRWQYQELEPQHLVAPNLNIQFETNKVLECFNQVIAQLPFAQREAFVLQQEGFSIHDIAEMTDSLPETIKSRIRYARQCIKHAMEQL